MQSTGHGGMQRSQPVHHSVSTTCICLEAPTIASTGHAWIHSVQPIHFCGSINATGRGRSVPHSGSMVGWSSNASCGYIGIRTLLRRSMPSMPPGGQRFGKASPLAMASAYPRQSGYPHLVHCVCGRISSSWSTRLLAWLMEIACGVLIKIKGSEEPLIYADLVVRVAVFFVFWCSRMNVLIFG